MTYEESNSPLHMAVIGLDRLLVESATFRRRVCGEGEASEVAAREKIELLEYEADPAELQRRRPFAAIWPKMTGWTQTAGGARNEFVAHGTLALLLTDVDRAGHHDSESRRASGIDFIKFAGEVLEEILAQAAADDHLCVNGVQQQEEHGPARSSSKDVPAVGTGQPAGFWWVIYLIDWGNAG